MRALRLTIEDSLRTENIGDSRVGRSREFSVPLAVWRHTVEVVVLDLHAFRDLLLLLGAGRGKFSFDGELDLGFGIFAAENRELAAECEFRERTLARTR